MFEFPTGALALLSRKGNWVFLGEMLRLWVHIRLGGERTGLLSLLCLISQRKWGDGGSSWGERPRAKKISETHEFFPNFYQGSAMNSPESLVLGNVIGLCAREGKGKGNVRR